MDDTELQDTLLDIERCEAGHDIDAVRQVEPRPGPGATRLGP